MHRDRKHYILYVSWEHGTWEYDSVEHGSMNVWNMGLQYGVWDYESMGHGSMKSLSLCCRSTMPLKESTPSRTSTTVEN